jgi:hypothetical protein
MANQVLSLKALLLLPGTATYRVLRDAFITQAVRYRQLTAWMVRVRLRVVRVERVLGKRECLLSRRYGKVHHPEPRCMRLRAVEPPAFAGRRTS